MLVFRTKKFGESKKLSYLCNREKNKDMKFDIEVTRINNYVYIKAVQDGSRIGKVCVDLDSDDSTRYINSFGGRFAKIVLVWTSPKYCRQGIATALLNKTVEILKDWNLYLNVIPQKRNENDMDRNQLSAFYSRFGFERYEADICTVTMIKKS